MLRPFAHPYGMYPSYDALQVSTLLAQHYGELLRPFASTLRLDADLRYREKHEVTMSELKPSSSKKWITLSSG